MKTLFLALLFVAVPDAGKPTSTPVVAVAAQPAAAPAVIDAGVAVGTTVQKVLDALPPPPPDSAVPGYFESLGKDVVDKNYFAAIIPLMMIALWFLAKLKGSKKAAPVAPAAESPVPPAKPEDPKPEQK